MYSANGLARTPRGPSVSTTGTSRAEHASPRPCHIPRGRPPQGLTREFPYNQESAGYIGIYSEERPTVITRVAHLGFIFGYISRPPCPSEKLQVF